MNNTKKIRIAVAGLGRIGWEFHAKNLVKHADYELVAVADPEAERRRQAETELGCQAFADYAAMLKEAPLDAVVIATPTHLHHPMALQAFARGLHVILEKPMAINSSEAEAIAAAAQAAGRRLTVYQPHRLAGYFRQLKQLVESGRIGRVYWAQIGMFNYARRNDWQSLQKFGGGMLANYGAHAVDQMLGLLGTSVKRVFCDMQMVATMGDSDDVVKIIVETAAGAIGQVDISMAAAISPYRIIVWGSCGAISFNGNAGSGEFHVRSFDPSALSVKKLDENLASAGRLYPYDEIPFREETVAVDIALDVDLFSDFAAAIRDNRAPAIPPQETVAVMKVLDRCRRDSGDTCDMRAPHTP